jgi:hypothetical protein
MADESYVKRIVDTIKAQLEKNELEAKDRLRDADTIKAEAPQKWTALKQWVKETVQQSNQHLPEGVFRYSDSGPNQFTVTCDTRKDKHIVSVVFSPANSVINISRSTGGSFLLTPKVDGNQLKYAEGALPAIGIDAVGEKILNLSTSFQGS